MKRTLATTESLPTDQYENFSEHSKLLMGNLYNSQPHKRHKLNSLDNKAKSGFNYILGVKQLINKQILNDPSRKPWLIIHHKVKWKIIFNTFIDFLLIYSIGSCLHFIAFNEAEDGVLVWDTFMQCIFGIDLIFCFFTDYKDYHDNLIVSHKFIMIRYLKSWFLIDVICLMPWRFLSYDAEYVIRLLRFFKFSRILNLQYNFLSSLFKIIKFSNQGKDLNLIRFIFDVTWRLSQLLIIMLTFIYTTACLFRGWYLKFDHNFDDVYLQNVSDSKKLLRTMYYISTTLLTIGFGDLVPVNLYEKGFMIIVIIIGIAAYSLIMATFNSTVSEFNEILSEPDRSAELNEWLEILEQKHGKIPVELRAQIVCHFANYKENNRLKDIAGQYWKAESYDDLVTIDHEYLQWLPKSIINSIINRIYSDIFFWFKEYLGQGNFKYDLAFHFQPRIFQPGEVILEKNTKAHEVLFVTKGRVICETFINGIPKTLLQFAGGRTVIGDHSCLTKTSASIDYVVGGEVPVQAFAVPRKAFLLLLNEGYPEKKNELLAKSTDREIKIGDLLSSIENIEFDQEELKKQFRMSTIDINNEASPLKLRTSLLETEDSEENKQEKLLKIILKNQKEVFRAVKSMKRRLNKKIKIIDT